MTAHGRFFLAASESLVISLASSVNCARSNEIRKNRFLAFTFSVMSTRHPVTFIHLLICSKASYSPLAQKGMMFLYTARFPLLNPNHISVLSSCDISIIPLFHTDHESLESPRIEFLLIWGGFVRFHYFFSPIVMFYESVSIQIRFRYEYTGESAQFGWNRARIHYD